MANGREKLKSYYKSGKITNTLMEHLFRGQWARWCFKHMADLINRFSDIKSENESRDQRLIV